MGYWPSAKSLNTQKGTRPISCRLERTSLVNKGFIIWLFFEHWKRNQLHAKSMARTKINSLVWIWWVTVKKPGDAKTATFTSFVTLKKILKWLKFANQRWVWSIKARMSIPSGRQPFDYIGRFAEYLLASGAFWCKPAPTRAEYWNCDLCLLKAFGIYHFTAKA